MAPIPTPSDAELAQELDSLRSRFFTLESKKHVPKNWEQEEAVEDEMETIADRIAVIYRMQRTRAKKRGTPPPPESPDQPGL